MAGKITPDREDLGPGGLRSPSYTSLLSAETMSDSLSPRTPFSATSRSKEELVPLGAVDRSSSGLTLRRPGYAASEAGSATDKFNLSPDPTTWGFDVNAPEPDDVLHNPGPRGTINDKSPSDSLFTRRGFMNVGCLAILCLLIVGLFLGYPVASHFTRAKPSEAVATGPMTPIANFSSRGLIDVHTPQSAHQIYGYHDSSQALQLVFSDEFEVDGRSFYPGDDPYWEAVDFDYWSTGDKEWYDPKQITTRAGALEITLEQVTDPTLNHNMNYSSGMMSTWNKFCFTEGLILASVQLPGEHTLSGFWPAVWTMGNLGRAGYGATLDGMVMALQFVPFPTIGRAPADIRFQGYDSCDVGTLPNQTLNNAPQAALDTGSKDYNGTLSYLGGQRLSRCTCKGESHPGPLHKDGSYVGRSAPEIDVIEAQIGGNSGDPTSRGQVSQSSQWAPFDASYIWNNSTDNMIIRDPAHSSQNTYSGGIYQEAASVVSDTNQLCYQLVQDCFAVHGFEYVPGFDNAYITWITDNKVTWTLNAAGVGANPQTQISARPIPTEPMYILINLGFSRNFAWLDERLSFPGIMRVDWVRVYQHPDKINIGCDPPDRPTQDYINTYIEAYTNPNLTTWTDDYKQPVPKNNLTSQC
ncbi:unnamed protein product [Mycena citricolor]|uniref:GH16 domain-containing protein n=1 Tax=Mycena citricolor TaxID=2018698 RepID=A0AAD2HII9_9AGAR|nr:unnamed protein product [Mycena citricolor]